MSNRTDGSARQMLCEVRAGVDESLAAAAAVVPRGSQEIPVIMGADPPLYWPTEKVRGEGDRGDEPEGGVRGI